MLQHYPDFKIIAEIGVNHEGDIHKACELTRKAADAGADIIKFQSYSPARLIAANNDERRKRVTQFALTEKEFEKLYALTDSLGVEFLSTPVTEDWIPFLDPLCKRFKIASGDITFKTLIQRAARLGKNLILSTGASTISEINQAVEWVKEAIGQYELKKKLTLLHCVSAYPTPIEQANILSIPFLHQQYDLPIGYSNHVIGPYACLGAVALGAPIIEIHFTDEKNNRSFRDHSLSFDGNDLKQFVYASQEIRKSLGIVGKSVQLCESQDIHLIRKGIIATRDLPAGTVLTEQDLMFARPATEYKAEEFHLLLGKKIKNSVSKEYLITRDNIECVE